jgi:hypothetical protein
MDTPMFPGFRFGEAARLYARRFEERSRGGGSADSERKPQQFSLALSRRERPCARRPPTALNKG